MVKWESNRPEDRIKDVAKELEFYKECVIGLLKGLEIQHINDFIDKLSPDNCLKLGKAYVEAVKERIATQQVIHIKPPK